jgi:adenine deaminase
VLSLCEDAHEIANVVGPPGIELFVSEGQGLPLNLFLRVPGRGTRPTRPPRDLRPRDGPRRHRGAPRPAAGLHQLERALIDELGCTVPYRPIYALNFLCLPNIPDVGVTDRGIIETATMELLSTVVDRC